MARSNQMMPSPASRAEARRGKGAQVFSPAGLFPEKIETNLQSRSRLNTWVPSPSYEHRSHPAGDDKIWNYNA